jgi:hypothetical protein
MLLLPQHLLRDMKLKQTTSDCLRPVVQTGIGRCVKHGSPVLDGQCAIHRRTLFKTRQTQTTD